jgi:hypothetical protein
MADTTRDGTGQGTNAGFIPNLQGGIAFVNLNSDDSGHATHNRFGQVPVAGDADFQAIPPRRPPGGAGLGAT